jgi:hypothetical protein
MRPSGAGSGADSPNRLIRLDAIFDLFQLMVCG